MLSAYRPKLLAASVYELPLERLRDQGIRALVLDLDNTLLPYNGMEVSAALEEWVRRVRSCGLQVLLLSNNSQERVEPIAQALQVDCLWKAGKPGRQAFLQAAERLGLEPGQCAAVGDQLMTDVIGASRAGLYAVLVNPIAWKEFPGTKVNRLAERLLLRAMGVRRPRRERAR